MRAREAAELVAEHGERLAAAVSGGAIGSTRGRLREFARERMRVMWGDEWLAAHEADLRAEGRDQSPS